MDFWQLLGIFLLIWLVIRCKTGTWETQHTIAIYAPEHPLLNAMAIELENLKYQSTKLNDGLRLILMNVDLGSSKIYSVG